jgi:hypothetical protein
MPDEPPPIPSSYTQEWTQAPLPPTSAGPIGGGRAPHRGGLIFGLGLSSLIVALLGVILSWLPPCCIGFWALALGLAIPAWVMANVDRAAMQAGRMDPAGGGLTNAGRICAIVAVILTGIFVLSCLGLSALSGVKNFSWHRPMWRP